MNNFLCSFFSERQFTIDLNRNIKRLTHSADMRNRRPNVSKRNREKKLRSKRQTSYCVYIGRTPTFLYFDLHFKPAEGRWGFGTVGGGELLLSSIGIFRVHV